MDWFLCDNVLRHERVKFMRVANNICLNDINPYTTLTGKKTEFYSIQYNNRCFHASDLFHMLIQTI